MLKSLVYYAATSVENSINNAVRMEGGNNKISSNSLISVASTIAHVLIFLVGFAAIAGIIYGGILFMISTGDAAKIQKAKNAIFYSIIGLVVAILSFAIANFVFASIS